MSEPMTCGLTIKSFQSGQPIARQQQRDDRAKMIDPPRDVIARFW
jgi:hypothetical protein